MPKLTINHNRTVRAPQVLDAFVTTARSYLSLELRHTQITEEDMWHILGYAAVHRLTPESACLELEGAPSGNRFREVMMAALPDRCTLQRDLNAALHSQLPKSLLKGKRSYNLAADLTLIPYHGQPQKDEDEVMRGKAKSGTTHFHGYATISIVHHKRRYVLALLFVEKGEKMACILVRLLEVVSALGISVRRIYLDKGFCAVPVFELLEQCGLSYIIPIPVRGRSGGVRRLFQGRASYVTSYTLLSPTYGEYTVRAVVVRRYAKGRYGRRGVKWFAYAVSGLPHHTSPSRVFELYRQRFGIETSYRQMNQVRARTTSRSPVLRLLLVGLAFTLVNLYVSLRDCLMTHKQTCRHRTRFWLSLRRLAFLLGRAVEQQLSVASVVQHHPSEVLS